MKLSVSIEVPVANECDDKNRSDIDLSAMLIVSECICIDVTLALHHVYTCRSS